MSQLEEISLCVTSKSLDEISTSEKRVTSIMTPANPQPTNLKTTVNLEEHISNAGDFKHSCSNGEASCSKRISAKTQNLKKSDVFKSSDLNIHEVNQPNALKSGPNRSGFHVEMSVMKIDDCKAQVDDLKSSDCKEQAENSKNLKSPAILPDDECLKVEIG